MYLWNTKALATELRNGTLTERERMKYYLLFMALLAVVTELPLYSPEPVTPALIATSVLSIVGTVIGIYVTYHANRSGDDRDFIARSVCLIFPVGVRVVAASIGVYIAYMIIGSIIGGDAFDQFTAHTTWVDVAFFCVVEVVLYWRLWHHFTWIARPHDAA
jgi:hypothetical protein